MTEAQLQNHDVLLYRNKALISPGTLLVREDFEAAHPDIVRRVLQAYAPIRSWAIANPDAIAQIPAKASGLSLKIAKLQLSQIGFTGEAVGLAQLASIACGRANPEGERQDYSRCRYRQDGRHLGGYLLHDGAGHPLT